ncbi:MAG: hypothetical protein RIQ54_93 [Candidatus Parcubacteria bacterium]|jgi:hypothetical protein
MKKIVSIGGGVLIVTLIAAYFLFPRTVTFSGLGAEITDQVVPVNTSSTTNTSSTQQEADRQQDAQGIFQPKLEHPPAIVRGLYITAWVAGISSRVDALIDIAKKNDINAVIVDIKDYSGYLSYCPDIPNAKTSGACDQIRISDPVGLIKKLHDNGLYVIGRISVFQDPIQAKAHPDWAIKDSKTKEVWRDAKGLAWLEVAAPEVAQYVVDIARDASKRGFDEINFDYVRFPSDGNLDRAEYVRWDKSIPRHVVLKNFFQNIRSALSGLVISADLFGLATVQRDDLGIGQVIEDAYPYFDYLYPMVYPSHYAAGFLGYKNPAEHPYEVIAYSMKQALNRKSSLALNAGISASSTTSTVQQAAIDQAGANTTRQDSAPYAKLRPWIQVFDLGAIYTKDMIDKQIQATKESMGPEEYAGWLLWDPKNTYTPLKR